MRKLLRLGIESHHWTRFGVWLALLFICASTALGASFNVTLDRYSVVLGEQVTLTLTFQDGQPDEVSNLPQVEGLRIASNVSRSMNSVFNNGAQTTVYSYSVVLEPTRVGEFVIPAFQAKIKGESFSSQPLKLKVIESDPTAPPPSFASKVAFLWLVLPKTNLYINEPMVAEFRIYFRTDAVRRYGNLQLPLQANGLTFSKPVESQLFQRRVGNATFTVLPLSVSIVPFKTGTLPIGPVNGSIVINNPDVMDGFFAPAMTPQQVALTLDPIPLQVSSLPTENVPSGFNGAVGQYTMSVTAGPTNVATGDPVTLRVQIAGHGPLDALSFPEQAGWDDFKVYPPTAKVNANDQLGIEGSKTFEEIVTPQNSDIKALPAISFSYFDPEQKAYRTLTQPAIPLVVKSAAPGAAPVLAAGNTPQDNAPVKQDILPIKQHIGPIAAIRPPLVQQPWFLALQSIPALALVSSVVWRKRKESLASNPRLRRQRQVAHLVRQGLVDLQRLASENKSDEFFATLFRLLQEQLGERLDVPASSITEAVVDERLRPRGVPESTLAALHELFQTCNLARYAPIKSSQELAAIVPRLEKALGEVREIKA